MNPRNIKTFFSEVKNSLKQLCETDHIKKFTLFILLISTLLFYIIVLLCNEYINYDDGDPRKINIQQSDKITMSGNLIGGSLALTAIAMSIIPYAISQLERSGSETTTIKIKQLIYYMYIITILSITTTIFSILHFILQYPPLFYATLIFIYIMSLAVVIATTEWISPIIGATTENDINY